MPALALTDHASLAGALEHIAGCQKHNIMPIMGVEVYYRDNRLWQEKENSKYYHLTLLAMSLKGWVNVQRLTSEAYQSGFYGKPCVDPELLAQYSEDVYCLGGCIGGRLAQHIITGYEPDVVQFVNVLRGIFKDRFSLEIMCHDFDGQRTLNIDTARVGYEHGIPLAATGDPHYPFVEWATTQDVRLMISTKQSNLKRKIKEEAGEDIYTMKQENPTLYLMNAEEKAAAFGLYHPQLDPRIVMRAIEHTGEIVSGFTPFMLDRDIKMPPLTRRILSKIDPVSWQEELAAHQNDEDWWNQVDDALVIATLRRWAFEGLEKLKDLYPSEHWFKYPFQDYVAQIEHELAVFIQIGIHVSRYMVMAAGEVRWARNNGIIVGPGRGSAAGSLVAYSIEITDIDPISYDLMFERFININRKGMPDIDIDFMPGAKGRDLVKAHTGNVYGEGNVIDIAAFGTYGPRSAVDAVCRVFDDEISFTDRDKYRRAIELKATDKSDLEECAEKFELVGEFKRLYPKLWEHATRIEGHPYSYSRHASGVLVKPSNIEIPTSRRVNKETGEKETVTSWPDTKELLANYGFLKLDFLVIDGLVRQYEVLKALRERDNTPIDLRQLAVRWDPEAVDPRVAELMAKGLTLGVWQFEGKGTLPVLKSVKPTTMHDIAAINALIRPGPREAGMTEQYAKRKHGIEPITYWHESVEPVLKKTHGLMIYQEQMMEIAVQLGDFTRTEADDLRKAMGKKYREGMAAVVKFLDELGYGTKFKHNAAFKVGEEMAIDIWENRCIKFGGYSFNASHAYAYGLISYHDGLLKVEAPADFYAWLLTSTGNEAFKEKLNGAMREGRKFKLKITPPDINKSDLGFKVLDKETILYGLESVKGVGPAGAKAIFEHRPYNSYDEFCVKVPAQACNKNAKKALIGVGAFDAFGMRALMTDDERATNEEGFMGVKLSVKNVTEQYAQIIEETIHTEEEFDNAPDGEFLCLGGEITNVKHTRTKRKNEAMGFVNLQYGVDSYRVTIFPPVWSLYGSEFRTGRVMFFEGIKQVDDQYGAGFIGKTVISLEELLAMRQNKTAA